MNGLKHYNIPIKVVGLGLHNYVFKVEDDFFKNFEMSPVEHGSFDVTVEMDKRPNIIELMFEIKGTIPSPCDRCLAEIPVSLECNNRMLVKYSEIDRQDEDEVVYVSQEDAYLNVASLIYEFIVLAIPILKRIDCEENNQKYCDKDVLEYYDKVNQEIDEDEEDENPDIWGSLKDIKLN